MALEVKPEELQLGDVPRSTIEGLSVVVPAYQEGNLIYRSLQEMCEALGPDVREIVVVDDGSTDETFAEVQRAAQEHKHIKGVTYHGNHGKGHALRYGFQFVTGQYVAFLDADGDLHPSQIFTLYRILEEEGADFVVGSKRHPQSQLDYPWHRRLMSSGYYLLIKLLFGLPIRDTQTGIKLFRYQPLKEVLSRVVVKRFAFDLELLVAAHRLGFRLAEAPVTLSFSRRFGRISIKDVYRIGLDTLAVFYRRYFRRQYDP